MMTLLEYLFWAAVTPVAQPADHSSLLAFAGVVLSALIAVAGAIYVQRSTKSLKEAENKRAEASVEAGAYDRARASYEAAIARYEADLARLGGQVDSCRKSAEEARAQAAHAEDRLDAAEEKIEKLKEVLREHQIPVPSGV